MQHEKDKKRNDNDDSLAEIWRDAQQRRADDIYAVFMHFFETRQQLKSSESRLQHPLLTFDR